LQALNTKKDERMIKVVPGGAERQVNAHAAVAPDVVLLELGETVRSVLARARSCSCVRAAHARDGQHSVVCTDKTGMLTLNEMTGTINSVSGNIKFMRNLSVNRTRTTPAPEGAQEALLARSLLT
jgi:hypothetical protein